MTGKHFAAIGLFLGGVAALLSSLHFWSEAAQPAFIGGLIAQAGAAVLALYSDKPGDAQ